jgi:hypothetical protein
MRCQERVIERDFTTGTLRQPKTATSYGLPNFGYCSACGGDYYDGHCAQRAVGPLSCFRNRGSATSDGREHAPLTVEFCDHGCPFAPLPRSSSGATDLSYQRQWARLTNCGIGGGGWWHCSQVDQDDLWRDHRRTIMQSLQSGLGDGCLMRRQ